VRANNFGKKTVGKCEQGFLYSDEYRAQKMGEKKRETIFPEIQE